MRSLLFLLAGALIGALVAFSAANTLGQRRAWPRGVMVVMQHHYAALRDVRRRDVCAADATASHWRMLAQIGEDIEPSAASTGPVEPDFSRQAKEFVQAARGYAADPPRDCAALDRALPSIKDACDGCHRDYR